MASADTLSEDELSFIKAMLDLRPQPADQVILSYFSRPGRDINHRVVKEVRVGARAVLVQPAPKAVVQAFMAAARVQHGLTVDRFLAQEHRPAEPYELVGGFRLDWWPAGQGLFASGTIQREAREPLAWVYDCGSWPDVSVISGCVEEFKVSLGHWGVERIRLAVLSHFDRDHITGFVELLKSWEVQTLLIPFVPRWVRLQIALSEELTVGDDLFEFYLDPVNYLAEAAGGRLGEIVIVPGAGPDDTPSDEPLEPTDPLAPSAEGEGEYLKRRREKLLFKEGPVPEGADVPSGPLNGFPEIDVRYLEAGGRLVVPSAWEFVPYNDANLAWKAPPTFLATAEALISDLLDRTRTDRDTTLLALKAHYETVFKTSRHRNEISLFLYSGPVQREIELRWARDGRHDLPRERRRYSQMHTGDAYLDTLARLEAFERYFASSSRLNRSAFLQVMHHGSKSNWLPGTADRLKPHTSLFCSDPDAGNHHPHAEVLRDFWRHRPIQVDAERGYHLRGVLIRW